MTTKSRKSATSLLIWILKNARTPNLPLQRTGLIGAMHSAETVMRHFDFTEHERLARTAPWNAVTTLFIQVGYSPETAGADMILLYASTGHSVAELRRRSMGRLFGSSICTCRKQAGLCVEEAAGLSGLEVSKWMAIEDGQVPQDVNR